MGPTWGPPGSWRPQTGPVLASWTLLSGIGVMSSWCDNSCLWNFQCRQYRKVHQQWQHYLLQWRVCVQGPDSIYGCHLVSIGNPTVEIRRSYDRLISTMAFPILVRCHLYIESGPWTLQAVTTRFHPRGTCDILVPRYSLYHRYTLS